MVIFHQRFIALSQFNTTTQSAQFVEKYEYSPYGITAVTLDGNTGNPYRFTGRRLDSETGLYYFRARTYSPTLGRFLQPDPTGYADGTNMYAYCGNNPLAYTDPLGLCKDSKWDDMTWGERLGQGYYYGTGYGEEALDYWAGKMAGSPNNPIYATMGMFSALWQPDNFKKNGTEIALMGGSRLIGKGLEYAGKAIKAVRGASKAGQASNNAFTKGTIAGKNNSPKSTLPRNDAGDYLPDPRAAGRPHTTLGTRVGRDGKPYTQGATFNSKGEFLGRTDVTNHGRFDHLNPHFHPATGPASVMSGSYPIP